MKKLLAFILAFTVVFSMTAMFTPVSASGKDTKGITYINYFDFSGTVDPNTGKYTGNNQWANKDVTSFRGDDYVDENGNPGGDYYPHALYYSGIKGVEADYTFVQNGEVIRLSTENTNNPGIALEVANMSTYPLGSESNGGMEYVKIRFKNNSPSTKLTLMGTNPYSGSDLDPRASATIEIEPNSSEWQEVIISMVEGSMNSTNNRDEGQNRWLAALKKFAIYPFGYGNDNESLANSSYYVDIDYVVLGSKEYVTNYQSELEKKEDAVTGLDFAAEFKDSEGKLKPGIIKQEYKLGETLDITELGEKLKLDITYNGDTTEKGVAADSVSIVYSFDKPANLPDSTPSWPAAIELRYGQDEDKNPIKVTYDVTVYNIKSVDYKYDTNKETDVDKKVYDKLDILKNGFTPTGISVLVTHYQINPETGAEWETIKTMDDVEISGADFSQKVELSEAGYYEYLVNISYLGISLDALPVKIKDLVGLELVPVESKAGAIYYGTDLSTAGRTVTHTVGDAEKTYTVNDYFDINCVYTDKTKTPIELTALFDIKNILVSADTKITGGKINATVSFSNTSYGINVSATDEVTVQTPSDITVSLSDEKTFDVDTVLNRDRFTVKYKYADGTEVKVDTADKNLVFKYDTSTPGSNLEGVLEVNGKKEATFSFGVDEAEFSDKATKVDRGGAKIKLLAPKFPTGWLVTIICAAVVLVLVGGWALLKYVFKVDFKRKKRVSLDDIF